MFIRASVGAEDFTAAMMGVYEALEKWEDDKEFQNILKMVTMKRREIEERPILKNEGKGPRKNEPRTAVTKSECIWSFQSSETISEVIALSGESFAVFSESGEIFVTSNFIDSS